MFKKGQKWYTEEEVAKKYEESRFTGGGKILDLKEKDIVLSLVDPEGKKILDIATGTGRFAEELSKAGGDIVGLDASKEMLIQNDIKSIKGDALKLPFKNKSFDVTISMRFFHLLKEEDIEDFIMEVERVTKNKFIFETLHPLSLRILYQWALPQGSRLYSNSFLEEKFSNIPNVKEVKSHQRFVVPYGIYQCLPLNLGENINQIDEHISKKYRWINSTVYWELYF